jgi:hypothetical protein
MGPRGGLPGGATLVGGKQGVYVDIGDPVSIANFGNYVLSTQSVLTCSDGNAMTHLSNLQHSNRVWAYREGARQTRKVQTESWCGHKW